MSEENSGISTLRRKRRKHPSMLRTPTGVEEVVPALSTWTVEDLLEAGAWDDELADFATTDEEDDIQTPNRDDE